MTAAAARYVIDRRILHRWLTRYANGGLEARATCSNKPDTCPHQTNPVIEARHRKDSRPISGEEISQWARWVILAQAGHSQSGNDGTSFIENGPKSFPINYGS